MDVFESQLFYIDENGRRVANGRGDKDLRYANTIDPVTQTTSYTLNDLLTGQTNSGGSNAGIGTGMDLGIPAGKTTSSANDPNDYSGYNFPSQSLSTPSMNLLTTSKPDFSYDTLNKDGSLTKANNIATSGIASFFSNLAKGLAGGAGAAATAANTQGVNVSNTGMVTGLKPATPPPPKDKTFLYVGIGAGVLLLIVGITLAALGSGKKPAAA